MTIQLESVPLRPYILDKKQPLPQFYCKTCQRLVKETNICDCFHRTVNPTENKCFNHNHYIPFNIVFNPIEEEQISDRETN